MRFLRPRLRAPAQMVVIGAVLAVIFGAAQGWEAAVGIVITFSALAAGYYAWGGKDTDMGAITGSRADERQASLQMRVTALQGKVMTAAAVLTYLIVVLGKATFWPKVTVWPFTIPLALASLAGLAGWVIYRDTGDGDDADGAHADGAPADPAGRRVPVRRL
jgi:hypothetical protein